MQVEEINLQRPPAFVKRLSESCCDHQRSSEMLRFFFFLLFSRPSSCASSWVGWIYFCCWLWVVSSRCLISQDLFYSNSWRGEPHSCCNTQSTVSWLCDQNEVLFGPHWIVWIHQNRVSGGFLLLLLFFTPMSPLWQDSDSTSIIVKHC